MSTDPTVLPEAIEATLQLYEKGERAQASEMWHSLVIQTTGLTAALARQCIEITEHDAVELEHPSELRPVLIEAARGFDSMEIEALSWELDDDDFLSGFDSGDDNDALFDDLLDDFDESSDELQYDADESSDELLDEADIPAEERAPTGVHRPPPVALLEEAQTLEFERRSAQEHHVSGFAPPRLEPGLSTPGAFEDEPDAAGSTLMGRRSEPEDEPTDRWNRDAVRSEIASAPPPWARGEDEKPAHEGFGPRRRRRQAEELVTLEAEPIPEDAELPPPWSGASPGAELGDGGGFDRPRTIDAIPLEEEVVHGERDFDRPRTITAEPVSDDEPEFEFGPAPGEGVELGERPLTMDAVPLLEDEATENSMRPVTVETEPIDPWADVAAALEQEEGERQKLHARHTERRRQRQGRGERRESERQPRREPLRPSQRRRAEATPIANPKVHLVATAGDEIEPPRSQPEPGRFVAEATPARGTAPPEEVAPSPGAEALEQSRQLLQEGDVVGGYLVVEQVLKHAPENYEAIYLANTLRERLKSHAISMLEPHDRCPELLVPLEAIYGLRGIDHRAGFLLSQLDGVATIDFLIHSGAMPADDAGMLLLTLERRDIISLGDG